MASTGPAAAHGAGEAGNDPSALLRRWHDDLASWAIPDEILASVPESPWALPAQVFARRADQVTAAPAGESYQREWAALDPPGSVLDVGSGAGAACLPLLPRTTGLTAVDAEEGMLALLAERAAARGVRARCVQGRWPQVAAEVPAADIVTCHHVLYNVADLEPFIAALTGHARRVVVAEVSAAHPMSGLNDLWLRFHGLRRPTRPTGADLLAILRALGLNPEHRVWQQTAGPEYPSLDELADVTRRRLCLPPDRADEVRQALIDAGVDAEHPGDLGPSGRDVLTIWWPGRAQ
ncbi:MAG: class I SAM-dependent methyltransferase [Streptosporangiaceae bacterium]